MYEFLNENREYLIVFPEYSMGHSIGDRIKINNTMYSYTGIYDMHPLKKGTIYKNTHE